MMTLKPPFIISARLLPGLQIADATLSLDKGHVFHLDLPDGTEHTIKDFRPGSMNRNIASWFAAILGFMGAAVESRKYRERQGETEIDPDGNERLFTPAIVDWAAMHSDEITMLELEIEESKEELISVE